MEAYGKGGMRAVRLGGEEYLTQLARLYWYTVEFGLIQNDEGLRIYGAGILSSKGESIYCLESPAPNRIWFDMKRIMQTDYKIDDYQATYWVIKSFEDLFEQTHQDFEPIYHELEHHPAYTPMTILPQDHVIHAGTGIR
jgi:phenylalanine-4-hydroxylase